jgi:hypothetical protein
MRLKDIAKSTRLYKMCEIVAGDSGCILDNSVLLPEPDIVSAALSAAEKLLDEELETFAIGLIPRPIRWIGDSTDREALVAKLGGDGEALDRLLNYVFDVCLVEIY